MGLRLRRQSPPSANHSLENEMPKRYTAIDCSASLMDLRVDPRLSDANERALPWAYA